MNQTHICKYCVFGCIDYRFQEALDKLTKKLGAKYGSFDRVIIPGGAGDTEKALDIVELAIRLHHEKIIILTGHEDCGAGKTKTDLQNTLNKLKILYPNLSISAYFLKLDGSVEEL